MPPAVSVIIPAYNASRTLPRTLASVFAQTFTDVEVIVVNDGSADTPALERAIAPWRDRIAYVAQENRGAAAARNTALGMARGEWVAFLDADDWWEPRYLEQQLAALAARPDLDLVYCDAQLKGESPLAGRTFMETAPSSGPVTVEALLSFKCNVITSGTVARRRLLAAVGGFDESLRRGHDFNLWVRLTHYGARGGYHDAVLLCRQIDPCSLSGDAVAHYERAIAAMARTIETLELKPHERAAGAASLAQLTAGLEMARGKACLRNGDFAGAVAHVARANRSVWGVKRTVVLVVLRTSPRVVARLARLIGRIEYYAAP